VTTNTWDYRNRLTQVVVKDAAGNIIKEARYTYDVNDRRIGVWEHVRSQAPTQRWTVYDGENPYADFDGSGSLTTRYLYGLAIDQILARIGASGVVDWYLTDHLGSVRQLVQSDGTVLDQINYDSFGQILSETDATAGDRFKFTAREWDGLVGEYYYRARYYGPDTGRFESNDPMSFAAGDTDLYRYVGNSPTNATDPSGMFVVLFAPLALFFSGGEIAAGLSILGLRAFGTWQFSQLTPLQREELFPNFGGSNETPFAPWRTGPMTLPGPGPLPPGLTIPGMRLPGGCSVPDILWRGVAQPGRGLGRPNQGPLILRVDAPRIARGPGALSRAVDELELDYIEASDELHRVKHETGRRPRDNVDINLDNGDIIAPETGEVIGNLRP
jgi:RHS repeat-associated protein